MCEGCPYAVRKRFSDGRLRYTCIPDRGMRGSLCFRATERDLLREFKEDDEDAGDPNQFERRGIIGTERPY